MFTKLHYIHIYTEILQKGMELKGIRFSSEYREHKRIVRYFLYFMFSFFFFNSNFRFLISFFCDIRYYDYYIHIGKVFYIFFIYLNTRTKELTNFIYNSVFIFFLLSNSNFKYYLIWKYFFISLFNFFIHITIPYILFLNCRHVVYCILHYLGNVNI